MGSPTFLTRFFLCNMGPSDIISGRSSDIIFGRPWQYNDYVIYNGCANIILVKTGAVQRLLKCSRTMSFWKGMTQQSFRTS